MAKKILLLGDSIRLGYEQKVKEKLGSEFEVYSPEDNCRFVRYTMFYLKDYLRDCPDPDLIHWNNGLWDTQFRYGSEPFTSPLRYIEDLQTVAGMLKAVTPRVIFATTTPVNPQNPEQCNDTIAYFNSLAVPAMQHMGLQINDLNAQVAPHIGEYICEDLTHLSEAGKEACASQVVNSILNLLQKEI